MTKVWDHFPRRCIKWNRDLNRAQFLPEGRQEGFRSQYFFKAGVAIVINNAKKQRLLWATSSRYNIRNVGLVNRMKFKETCNGISVWNTSLPSAECLARSSISSRDGCAHEEIKLSSHCDSNDDGTYDDEDERIRLTIKVKAGFTPSETAWDDAWRRIRLQLSERLHILWVFRFVVVDSF